MGEPREMPRSEQSEIAVLYSIIMRPDALFEVMDVLNEEDFYSTANRLTFAAILALYRKREKVDACTVCEKMKALGTLEDAGGASFINGLLNAQATSANVVSYARRVRDKAIQRRIIELALNLQDRAYRENEDGPRAIIEDYNEVWNALLSTGADNLPVSLRELAIAEVEKAITRAHNPVKFDPIIKSGLVDFDILTGGFKPGSQTIIAARTGMGKSALALAIAIGAAEHGSNVYFLSLEMPGWEISQRAVSMGSGYSVRNAFDEILCDYEYQNIMDAAEVVPGKIYVDDKTQKYIDIRAAIMRTQNHFGNIGLVIIDYIQQITPPPGIRGRNREQEIAAMSRGLKLLALELKLPFIVLAQLNRDPDKSGNNRPKISHLRESGALENDADKIILIYRDVVYNPNTDDRDIAEITVGKNRGGKTGMVKMLWIGESVSFKSLSRREEG